MAPVFFKNVAEELLGPLGWALPSGQAQPGSRLPPTPGGGDGLQRWSEGPVPTTAGRTCCTRTSSAYCCWPPRPCCWSWPSARSTRAACTGPAPTLLGPIGPRGGGPEAAMLESCFCVLHRLCEYFLGAGLEDGSPPPHAVFVSNAQGRDSPGPCLTPFSSTCLPINGLAFL